MLFYLGAILFIGTSMYAFLFPEDIRFSKMDLPVVAFIFFTIVSFIFSSSKSYSFYYLAIFISYFVIFFSARIFLNEKKTFDVIYFLLILVALLVTIYGIFLHFHIDILNFYDDPETIKRTPSTMGNPNFFAGFLILTLFPAVSGVFYFRNIILKVSSGFTSGLILYSILLTRTRAAFVGLLAGIIIFAGIFLYKILSDSKLKEDFRKLLKIFIPASLLLIILIFFIAPEGYWNRLTAAINLKSVSTTMFRIYTWNSTLKIIKDHPVFGSGVGTFRVEYPSRKSKRIFMFEEHHNAETIHAHNEFLEVISDTGSFGMLSYLWILITLIFIFFSVIKRLKNLRFFFLYLGIFTSVFASLANNFFSVNMRYVSSGVTFWILLGLIFGLMNLNIKSDTDSVKAAVRKFSIIFLVISLLWSIVIIPKAVRYYRSDKNLKTAVELSKMAVTANMRGSLILSLYYYEVARGYYIKTLKFDRNNVIANYFMGNLYQDAGELMRESERFNKEAVEIESNIKMLRTAAAKEIPGSMRRVDIEKKINDSILLLNTAKKLLSDLKNPANAFEKSIEYYNVVVKNSPYYVQIHYHKGRALRNLNRFEEAITEFEMYLKQNPVDFEAYFILAELHRKTGNQKRMDELKEELVKEVNEDLRIFPSYLPLHFTLYKLSISENKPEEAERILLEMFKLPDIHLNKGFDRAVYLLYSQYISSKQFKKIDEFKKAYLFNNLKTFE